MTGVQTCALPILLCPPGVRILAHPDEATPVGQAVGTQVGSRVLLAIGPEGGWNAFERRLLESRGFVPVGMGARVLRSDTSCIALLALVHEAVSARERGGNGRRPASGIMP